MKKCPYCKNPIYAGAKRCAFCGRNLDLELARKLEMEKLATERWNRWVRAAFYSFGAMVILAAGTIWTALYSPIGREAKIAATQTAAALAFCDPDKVRAAADELIDYNDRWADIMALAVSVGRENVVIQVDRLQTIRRDARAVGAPGCMQIAKNLLITGMDIHVEALLSYMRGEAVETVNREITRGNLEMNAFGDMVRKIQRCAPDCR